MFQIIKLSKNRCIFNRNYILTIFYGFWWFLLFCDLSEKSKYWNIFLEEWISSRDEAREKSEWVIMVFVWYHLHHHRAVPHNAHHHHTTTTAYYAYNTVNYNTKI